jgi:integrase
MKNLDAVAPVSEKKSTLQSLSKIPSVPGLYRHENGTYYGKKKIAGVKKVAALTTENNENISDRKLAEKALAVWVAKLENPAPKEAKMAFSTLLAMLKGQWSGKAESTVDKVDWVVRCFEVHSPAFLNKPIDAIKPSDLSEFFSLRSKNLGAQAFNEMSRIIRTAFELAVNDGILSASPYAKVPKTMRRKRIIAQPAPVPTIEQCEAITANIRSQVCNRHDVNVTADLLEFMHKAALGTAECLLADWSKVNWEGDYIEVRRQKTGAYFRVPIFAHLKDFLADLHKRQGNPKKGPLFSILSPKQALYNACRRLNLTKYSPIDFRKARITWMLRKGIPAEMIAKWQGHKDNGVLIRKTYAWVISEADKAYELEQLAKLTDKKAA